MLKTIYVGLLFSAACLLAVLLGRSLHSPTGGPVAGSVMPYRFHLREDDASADSELRFYKERASRNPSGQDLASLAACYLSKARHSGEPAWYLLAEQSARRSLDLLPVENPPALIVLARVDEARHDFRGAIRLAQEVLASKPSNGEACSILVTSYLGLGEVDRARAAADRLRPSLTSACLVALTDIAQGQDQKALAHFRLGLAQEEEGEKYASAWARTLLGRFYLQRGRLNLAGDLFWEALRILPRYPFALMYMAEYQMAEHRFGEAEKYYGQAYHLSPQPIYLMGQARAREKQGNASGAAAARDQAEAVLRRQVSADSFGHRRDLARLLLERGQAREALPLAQAEATVRRDAETLDVLGCALLASGQPQQAQEILHEARRFGLRDANILYHSAQAARRLGEARQADELMRQVHLVNPAFDIIEGARLCRAGPSDG